MARLGFGMMIIAQSTWENAADDTIVIATWRAPAVIRSGRRSR